MKPMMRLIGGSFVAFLVLGHAVPKLLAQQAYLKVFVPPGATVEIDGAKTMQTGPVRLFVSPVLDKSFKYAYQVKATFTQNGKQVTVEKTVAVEPGRLVEANLSKGELAKVEPKKEEPKKEEPKKEEPKKETKPKEIKEPEKPKPKVELKKEPADEPRTIVVPYVNTPQNVVDEMLKLAGVKEGDVVYDLGCGDGRIVVTAVQKFKAKKGFGLDLNPERIKDSLETAKKAGVQDRVKFQQGDVLKIEDVSEANVVTLYLLPEVNLRLAPMLKKTLKPGSRIVSHDFDMGDWAADKKIEVKGDSGRDHTIYLWTIPGAKKEEPKKVTEPKKSPPMPSAELADELADEPKTIVVPYVPTPQKVVDEMLKLADVKEGDVVYDLGCGDGRIVVTALKKFNAKKGYGIDLNPERVKDSYENAKKAGVEKNVKFEQGDVLKIKDVSEANVVTLYLLPDVNLRLAPMLKKTLKPGSRIVSHDFHMGDWKAEKKIQVVDEDGLHHDIYLWTIPGKKK